MGTCSKAALSLGFVIPPNKLLALLECFRKEAYGASDSEQGLETGDEGNSVKNRDQDTDIGRAVEEKKELRKNPKKRTAISRMEALELHSYIVDKMDRWVEWFQLILTGIEDGDDGDPIRLAFAYRGPHECERWGRENYGAVLKVLGDQISSEGIKEEGWEEVLKEFQHGMHFEEAGIELPLKDEWLLYLDIS